MPKTRVIYVIESASGGSLTYLMGLVGALDPECWDVCVVFSRRMDTPNNIESLFPNWIEMVEVSMRREVSIVSDLKACLTLRKLILERRPDIVHCHSSKAGVVGRIAAIRTPAVLMYTPHGFSFFRRDIGRFAKFTYWLIEYFVGLVSRCWYIVGSREEMRQSLRIAPRDRVILVPNAVPIPKKFNDQLTATRRCATVGRLTPAKNPELVMKIVEEVCRRIPDMEFLWIGDGELREEVERQCTVRGIQMTITGWLPAEEVFKRLKSCRVYVQASSWEALPLSLLEAMANGVPVVASDITAHRDIITPDENGILCGSVDEFSRAIELLFGDDHVAMELRKNARTLVEADHSLDRFVSNITNAYHSAQKLFTKGSNL